MLPYSLQEKNVNWNFIKKKLSKNKEHKLYEIICDYDCLEYIMKQYIQDKIYK